MTTSAPMPTAQLVVPCTDLESTVDWFCEVGGFRMLLLRPADDPTIAVLDGHGLQVRVDRTAEPGHTEIRIPVEAARTPATAVGPNGTVLRFVAPDQPDRLPVNQPAFVVNRASDADFGQGRAGMLYRDLIPDRHGGRYIASHISIPTGGPVPDYVHHHHIRFQMIFCNAGWADLVYEDQGPPFRFEAGDCVLQPPHIRHRVLATSDNFEVVEIGSPAVHDTLRDHDLLLPTGVLDPDRDFGGQRFVRHDAAAATAEPWRFPGFEFRDFGIGPATDDLATVGTVTAADGAAITGFTPTDEFTLWFIRRGRATLTREGEPFPLGAGDSVVLAPGETYAVTEIADDLEFLEVRVP
ncbi:MAG: cupin [Actinomycetota bacterium]